MKIDRSEIHEVIRYGFECPKCGEWIEVDSISDISCCFECDEDIDVED